MSRKTANPEEVSEILALREAGYTAVAISHRLDVSVRTVYRHIAANRVKKGKLKVEIISRAKEDLLKLVSSNKSISEEIAKLISDDIAHSKNLRDIIAKASEHLVAASPKDALIVMRAAAAYSTALKNTSDTIRHTLELNRPESTSSELPELSIREITNHEAVSLIERTNDEDGEWQQYDMLKAGEVLEIDM